MRCFDRALMMEMGKLVDLQVGLLERVDVAAQVVEQRVLARGKARIVAAFPEKLRDEAAGRVPQDRDVRNRPIEHEMASVHTVAVEEMTSDLGTFERLE